MDEEIVEKIEDTVEELPDEISDFIFGDELRAIKVELLKHIEKQDEKDSIDNTIMIFLLGGISMDELKASINSLSISDEEKGVVANIIQEKIINELLLTLAVHKDMDKKLFQESNENASSNQPAPTPSDMLARLNQTMTAPSTLAPTKRVYATEPTTPTPPSNPPAPTGIKSIDPYREMPDAN